MIHKKIVMVSLLTMSLTSTTIYAANNGSTPNGKPFNAIQEQFSDVQLQFASIDEQMEAVVGRVENLEERVTVNEASILSLEDKNLIIEQQITELVEQTGENRDNIIAAFTQIMEIRKQIADLSSLVGDNSSEIAQLQQQLSDLELYVEQNASGVLALEAAMANNAMLIDALRDDVEAIKVELVKKQNILTGQCPVGSSLRAINPEGGISCEYDDHASGLHRITASNYVLVPGRTTYTYSYSCGLFGWSTCYGTGYSAPVNRSVTANCPTGTVVVGGSVSGDGLTITAQHIDGDAYYAAARNDSTTGRILYSNATCLSLYSAIQR